MQLRFCKVQLVLVQNVPDAQKLQPQWWPETAGLHLPTAPAASMLVRREPPLQPPPPPRPSAAKVARVLRCSSRLPSFSSCSSSAGLLGQRGRLGLGSSWPPSGACMRLICDLSGHGRALGVPAKAARRESRVQVGPRMVVGVPLAALAAASRDTSCARRLPGWFHCVPVTLCISCSATRRHPSPSKPPASPSLPCRRCLVGRRRHVMTRHRGGSHLTAPGALPATEPIADRNTHQSQPIGGVPAAHTNLREARAPGSRDG